MSTEAISDSSVSFVIAKFDKALHDRSAFSCGRESVDNFLKLSLSREVRSRRMSAFMATQRGDSSVLGFYTLCVETIRCDLGPGRWRRSGRNTPVIYVPFVGVREDKQGHGLGRFLMLDAMERSSRVSEEVGAVSLVLDVLDGDGVDRRRKFYLDLGFRSLEDSDNPERLYISMSDIESAFAPSGGNR